MTQYFMPAITILISTLTLFLLYRSNLRENATRELISKIETLTLRYDEKFKVQDEKHNDLRNWVNEINERQRDMVHNLDYQSGEIHTIKEICNMQHKKI
jgi:hypothetical protein